MLHALHCASFALGVGAVQHALGLPVIAAMQLSTAPRSIAFVVGMMRILRLILPKRQYLNVRCTQSKLGKSILFWSKRSRNL